MFWLRNKKNTFLLRTLIWRPVHNIIMKQFQVNARERVQKIPSGDEGGGGGGGKERGS